MSSINALGSTLIFVTFELARDIDHAARDVQAALNAAVTDLPAGLPTLPGFRKATFDSAPVLILALTSDTLSPGELYDVADSVLLQRLSQVEGVAAVSLAGADQPAMRVSADPARFAAMNLSLDDLRGTIVDANALTPTGAIDGGIYGRAIATDDQLAALDDYRRLVVRNADGGSVLLGDGATVARGSRNDMAEATLNSHPAVLISITNAPGANVLRTIDAIRALLPRLDRFLPRAARITVLHDRALTIRASVDDMTATLVVSVALVVGVVGLFLRRLASIVATAVTIPLALAGTAIGMWLAGFSLDNISLMALVTAIGFVIDDAVAMIEAIDGVRDRGGSPRGAAVAGAGKVCFTLLAIAVSLVSAFIPLLFLGGVVGRFFREFSVTLAVAASTLGSSSERTSPVNQERLFIALKPQGERGGLPAGAVITRLRGRLRSVVGITTYLQNLQELQGGGPSAKSPLQITLADSDESELLRFYPAALAASKRVPGLADVGDDHGLEGLQANLAIDRLAASRLGVTVAGIDNALSKGFAQRQVSTLFGPRHQYCVVLALPRAAQGRPADILDTRCRWG